VRREEDDEDDEVVRVVVVGGKGSVVKLTIAFLCWGLPRFAENF
jgi:hypothetical protein